jgi:K+ transporter
MVSEWIECLMQVSKSKIGAFFLYIGLILVVVFFATDPTEVSSYGAFFGGVACVWLGLFLIWRDLKTPGESQRFRRWRAWREKGKVKKPKQE